MEQSWRTADKGKYTPKYIVIAATPVKLSLTFECAPRSISLNARFLIPALPDVAGGILMHTLNVHFSTKTCILM